MINAFFIKSLDEKYIENSINSFKKTLTNNQLSNFKINMVEELETREKTLNKILELSEFGNDLMIIADDILFTENWYDNLQKSIDFGDIIGFSMKKPNRNEISNRGFNFVKINGTLSYLPNLSKISNGTAFINCDFVTGCCMYIKSKVLKHNIIFPKEGFNRWGEIIFAKKAKDLGFRVICLSHVLEHFSKSTKNKSNKLSSTSYLIEQKLWGKVVNKYFQDLEVEKELKIEIGKTLKKIIENNEKKLIYGAGFITECVLKNCKYNRIEIVSGLNEEWGLSINNIKVQNVLQKNLDNFDKILITAIGYEKEVKEKYFSNFEIIKLEKLVKNNTMFIDLKEKQ